METLGGVFIAAVIFYGGSQIINNELTKGEFFAFVAAMLI